MNPDSTFSQTGAGMALAKSGKPVEARKALERLQSMKTRTYVSPAYVALVYLALGDTDAEYLWLEKGYDDRAEWLLCSPWIHCSTVSATIPAITN